jgi:type IV pilus assembly protein PilM
MFLSNPFPDAFGLDIGDLSIKLVQFYQHSFLPKKLGLKIKEIREVSLQPGLIVNGEIVQPELVRKKILHLLGKAGSLKPISSPWVVADLPEPKTFLKLIEVATPEKELMYEDISYHAKKHVPFDIEETYLDWRVIESSGLVRKTLKVLIAAVPKISADSYTYLLEAAGLSPVALEIEAVPIVRTLFAEENPPVEKATAILDFGATRSSLIIYDHGHIQFSTSLRFSGELLTTSISQALKLSHQESEVMKIEQGLKYDRKNSKYLKATSSIVSKLIVNISENLAFYTDHFTDPNPIGQIIISGGSSKLLNLDRILTQKLRLPVKIADVWQHIQPPRAASQINGPSFISAIGLGLRALRNPLKSSQI